MWHGVLLFLLRLLTGLVEQRFTNVRMWLAAHLEGLMNGTFLIALGAIWTEVSLPPLARATTYWVVLYGTYAKLAVHHACCSFWYRGIKSNYRCGL
jgi:(hydroxyamino)benzene mutase